MEFRLDAVTDEDLELKMSMSGGIGRLKMQGSEIM